MDELNGLVAKISAIQKAEGHSDRAFATKLRLSNGQWSGIKSGRIVMGRKTLKAIEKHYPGLAPDIQAYWLAQLVEAEAVA